MRREYTFYVYTLTNPTKTSLYIGFSGSMAERLKQHKSARGETTKAMEQD